MPPEIIYETQSHIFWDWRVALDLFFGGAGVGALLFAVLLDELFHDKYRRICQTAAWLSPLLVATGLGLLLLKMGRPLHLYQALINFNPHSPLWWGGIFQPLLLIGSLAYAWRWQATGDVDATRKWLGRCLAPLAVIVGTYHGLLLAINVSRPLWNTGPTVVASILGFASTGIAMVLIVHLLRMKLAGRLADGEHLATFLGDLRFVRNTLATILLLQLATYFFWWLSLKYGSLADQQALAAANESYGPMFWFLGIGLGIVLPLLLGGWSVLRGEAAHRKLQVGMIAVTSLMILVGGAFFRLALVLGGQAETPLNIF